MAFIKKNILFLLLLLITLPVFSQSRKELEYRKRQKQKEIAYTHKLLQQTRKSKKKTYNELLLINKQINNRRQLIQTYQQELEQINKQINEHNEVIDLMSKDLERLKKEYAKIIYYSWKTRNSYDKLMFILSAKDFDQAYKRLRYLQEYAKFRKAQAEAIKNVRALLVNKISDLNKAKEKKQAIIKEQQQQTLALKKEKEAQAEIVASLKQQETKLQKQLRKQKEETKRLQAKIAKIIAEEARKAAKKSKKTGKFALTPEERLISKNFGANKGRLPWPTERGIITGTFGKHQHQVYKEITTENIGIDISTTPGSFARAVFDGTVIRIITMSPNNNVVLIKHGDYISVYEYLKEVLVTVGDKVKAKQKIGLIYTNPETNQTVINFQIWKKGKKQNPASWISKK